MESIPNWQLTEEEKKKLVAALTPELVVLRNKAGISQEELATAIGVTRQTYGAIERNKRKMTWNTYLSLILFYDYNKKTRSMIRSLDAYPSEFFRRINGSSGDGAIDPGVFLNEGMENIIDCLDEQALNSIRTMIMVEYARCTNLTGEAVIKAFEGRIVSAAHIPTDRDLTIRQSLRNIGKD